MIIENNELNESFSTEFNTFHHFMSSYILLFFMFASNHHYLHLFHTNTLILSKNQSHLKMDIIRLIEIIIIISQMKPTQFELSSFID